MSTGLAFPKRSSPFFLTLFLIPYYALAASLVQSSNQVVVSPHVVAFIGEEDKEKAWKCHRHHHSRILGTTWVMPSGLC